MAGRSLCVAAVAALGLLVGSGCGDTPKPSPFTGELRWQQPVLDDPRTVRVGARGGELWHRQQRLGRLRGRPPVPRLRERGPGRAYSRPAAAGAFDSLSRARGGGTDRRRRRSRQHHDLGAGTLRDRPTSRPRGNEEPDTHAVPRGVDPPRRHRQRGRRAGRHRGDGHVRQLEELGRRDPGQGMGRAESPRRS